MVLAMLEAVSVILDATKIWHLADDCLALQMASKIALQLLSFDNVLQVEVSLTERTNVQNAAGCCWPCLQDTGET